MPSLDLVRQKLIYANNLDDNFFKLQSELLLRRRVDFCDFYLQCATTESWSLDEGIIKSASFAINQGIGIRAICGDKTFLRPGPSVALDNISRIVLAALLEITCAQFDLSLLFTL